MQKIKKVFIFLLLTVIVFPLFIPQNAQASAEINKKTKIMYVGSTLKLKITGSNERVMWKSSDSNVATVSKKGKVKAKSPGTATITATIGAGSNNQKLTCTLKIKPRLSADTYEVFCPLDEFQEIPISFKAKKKNESIVAIGSYDVASFEIEEVSDEEYVLYVTPENVGQTEIKIHTAKNADSFLKFKINSDEYIAFNIYIGITENAEWINLSDLDNVYSVHTLNLIDCLEIMKSDSSSLNGIASVSYTLQLESSCDDNVIYGEELRYKYTNNQIYLNISDLKTLGFIE